MPRKTRSILAAMAMIVASSAFAQQRKTANVAREKAVQAAASSPHWLDISLKARSMLVDPADGELHEVMHVESTPTGLLSPDGRQVAFIASDPERVRAGYDFDLFIADVDSNQASGKSNVRRVTTDQIRPANAVWTHTSDGLAFLAHRGADDANESVWFIDFKAGTPPQRLSDEAAERTWQLSITPAGRIAWVQLKARKSKEQFSDLIVQKAPNQFGRASEGGGRDIVLNDQHISSYAFSPDGKSLAWSGLGSMFIVNLESNASREIPLHGIHRQLLNHSVYVFAWRPDGKVIAIYCGFLGGVARAFNADPNEPWPRMFAEDKVFFVTLDWNPTPESLNVTNENFPSPTADDPKAEVSPPAGDESKPWWIRELPMSPIELQWITADEAQQRIKNSK